MTGFLASLKADLLDRRLLPLLALVGVVLAAAVAYAVLGGGSTPATPTSAPSPRPVSTGIAVSQPRVSAKQAVAETTSGSSAQSRGRAHDPFNPLPGAKLASTTTPAAATKTASPTTTGTSGSSSKGEAKAETKPTSTPKPSTQPESTTVYLVSVLFGVIPLAPGAQLTPHDNLKLLTALPTAKQPLIVFRGVTEGGKSASFTVVGEVILHGNAACLPSASQCQEIDLKPGQAEQLEYLPPSGPPVTYELKIVRIASSKASSAKVASILRGESKAGREVLRRYGLVAIPDLRYSSIVGVLTFAGHTAAISRAHASA
jgi:hypothetical protein